ncbi:phosphatase PAP2 family protein [Candidatus Saccharibacteria bacterium]|nr:phosphatase PAP2 family protein [Candidatus Saccharibacteria bacterium]
MQFLIIITAQYLLYALLLIAFIWLVTFTGKKKWRIVMFAVAAGLISILLAKVGAYFISDPRPFTQGLVPLFSHAPDNGFPSDHTLLAATLAFVVAVYSWRLGTVLFVGTLAIGGARVAANVHHIADIIGAIVIAGIATLIVWVVSKGLAKQRVPV